MGFLFPTPKAPAPPPPPPSAASPDSGSIAETGAAQRASLASAEGSGSNGTDVTGGEGASAPATTKSLLGS